MDGLENKKALERTESGEIIEVAVDGLVGKPQALPHP